VEKGIFTSEEFLEMGRVVDREMNIRNIFEFRPDSHGAEDYLSLCRQIKIIERGERMDKIYGNYGST
jgi:hypothetical protein